jgi:YVTN family beta-propeller protein
MNKVLVAILVMINASAYGQVAGQYGILKTFPVQGDGRWDYLAVGPVKDYLYIAHGTQVNVIDKLSGAAVAVIPNTTGVHGIAFAPDVQKGFISNGKLSTVTVFDLNTNEVKAEIKTGENPDAIMYDEYCKKIFVCNGKSKDLTVIDPTNNKVVTTIALGGKPETAVSDESGSIYINIEDKSEIVRLNANKLTITARWPLGKGVEGPSGLAIDKVTKRLYSGCDKVLVVINSENGKIITTLPIGDGCDGVVFDASERCIFSSNGDGTLDVIKEITPDKYKCLQKLVTQKGARTIALDKDAHVVYLPTADFSPVAENAKRTEAKSGTFRILEIGKL